MLVINRGCINHIHRLSIDYPSSNFKRGPVAPLGAVQLCTQRLQQLLRRRRHVTCEDRKKLTGCGWCGMGQNLEYVWNLIYLIWWNRSCDQFSGLWVLNWNILKHMKGLSTGACCHIPLEGCNFWVAFGMKPEEAGFVEAFWHLLLHPVNMLWSV